MARNDAMAGHRDAVSPILFCVFVVIGCAYIIGAKFSGFPAYLVTSIPIGIMLVYAATLFLPAFRLRLDQGGDNLYYMGFLLTLTSLGVSLYQFDASSAAQEIVQNFGIAIGSTIAGVWLRVLFSQMRRDPTDIEQASRAELSEAARRIRRELEGTALEFAHFRLASQQSLVDGLDEVHRSFDEASEKLLRGFAKTTAAASSELEQSSQTSATALALLAKAIEDNVNASANHLADQTTRLADGSARISEALEATAARLAEMQTPDQIIQVKLHPAMTKLTKAVEDFAQHMGTRSDAERAASAAVAEALGKDGRSINELVQSLERQSQTIVGLGTKIESQLDLLRQLVEAGSKAPTKELAIPAWPSQSATEPASDLFDISTRSYATPSLGSDSSATP